MLQHLLQSVVPGKLLVHQKCCGMCGCKRDGGGKGKGGERGRGRIDGGKKERNGV